MQLTEDVMNLSFSGKSFDIMKKHAEDIFPNECCGFFFGSQDSSILVTSVHPINNIKEGDQRRRFEVSPLDYMKAERFALENNVALLGVYHSHPNHPAIPSGHDLKQAVPNFSYIILSIQNGQFDDIRSWRLKDQNIFEEEIINY